MSQFTGTSRHQVSGARPLSGARLDRAVELCHSAP